MYECGPRLAPLIMPGLLQAYMDIAFMRQGPQDLPASSFLFLLTLITNITITILQSFVNTVGDGDGELVQIFLSTLWLLLFVWLVLSMYGRRKRFLQSGTALLGADAFLSLLQLPLLAWRNLLNVEPLTLAAPDPFILGLYFWFLVIVAQVFRHALEIPLAGATAIAVIYFATVIGLANLMLAGTT